MYVILGYMYTKSANKPYKTANKKKLNCDRCPKKYIIAKRLRDHCLKAHKVLLLMCEVCNLCFPTKESRDKHHTSYHTADNIPCHHRCRICIENGLNISNDDQNNSNVSNERISPKIEIDYAETPNYNAISNNSFSR